MTHTNVNPARECTPHPPPLHRTRLTQPDRTKRVKDARNEAQKEIDEYKKEKDNEYQEFESKVRIRDAEWTWGGLTAGQHSSGNQKAEDDAKKDTDGKVKEIDQIGSKSGSKVVEQLITAVTDAKPQPPKVKA
jgi:V-type H+-transporting ATPase subunit G